jgi:hypothetical protein
MSFLRRRALLHQLAPALLSASAPSLLWSPAHATGTVSLQKISAANKPLSINLSEVLAGTTPPIKMTLLDMISPGKGNITFKNKNDASSVTYNPNSGFYGNDAFAISLLADAKLYIILVSIVVTKPEEPSGPRILVSDATQLRAALTSAKPGSRIVLADGIYSGDFVVTQPGTQAQPIVIQASKTLGTTLTGQLIVQASDVSVVGLTVTKGIDLDADRTRASRCRVDGSGLVPPIQITNGTGVVVEFCELINFGGRGLQIEGRAQQPRVYRNWVHGQVGSDSEAIAAIISGVGRGTSATPIGAHIIENLIEDIRVRQAIETKSSGNRIEGNTVIGTEKPADILVRHGLDNVLIGNWVEDGRVLVGDMRSVAVRNWVGGKRFLPCIGVKAGDITGNQLRAGKIGYPISEDARLIANEGIVDLGWRYSDWNLKPLATAIEAHNQKTWPVKITRCDSNQITYATTTSFSPMPPAPRQLTTADVGPFGKA